jgi:iron complex outermembrane receptor protein
MNSHVEKIDVYRGFLQRPSTSMTALAEKIEIGGIKKLQCSSKNNIVRFEQRRRKNTNGRDMTHLTPGIRLIALSISPSMLALSQPAYAADPAGGGAEDAATRDSGAMPEIVVTAQRRSESLQDVPVTVNAVTGGTLERVNITNLENVSVRMPAVVIRPTPGGDQIFIRGAGSGFNPGFEQSVATFVDGVYRPRARSSRLGLFDLEQIEILKGPQTTYFGANAIAGALNITSRRPADEFGAKAVIVYSPRYDEQSAIAALDVPVADGLAFRVVGGVSGRDAYTYNTRVDDRGEQKTRQARVSMAWEPAPAVEIFGRFDYARVRNTGDAALEIVGCPPNIALPAAGQCLRSRNILGDFDDKLDRRNANGFLDVYNMDFYEGVANAAFDFGTGSIIATTAYQDQQAFQLSENSNFPVPGPVGTSSITPSNSVEHHRQFSQELRVQSDLGGAFEYMAGVYYERSKLDVRFINGAFQANFAPQAPTVLQPGDLPVLVSPSQQKSETMSGFATADLKFADIFKATVGLRYSRVEKKGVRTPYIGIARVEDNAVGRPNVAVDPAPLATQLIVRPLAGYNLTPFPIARRVDTKLMPSIKLSATPTDDLLVYLSYSNGFKAGGYSLQLGSDVFDPETVNSYEAGLKASWLGNRVTTNIAIFQADFDGLQEAGTLYSAAGTPMSYIGNVAAVRSRGIEFSGFAKLTDHLSFHGDIALLDSKFLDYRDAPCSPVQSALAPSSGGAITCPNDLTGERRANAPKWSGSVGADYSRDVGSDLVFDAGVNVYFRSKYFLQSIPEDLTSQSGFSKVDLTFGIRDADDRWEVQGFVQNLTDKLTASFKGHAPGAVGTTQAIADPGRTFGVRLTVRYGAGH